MSNGYSVIPIDNSEAARESLQWLAENHLYALENLPTGRFPTLSELRAAIQTLGFSLEEGQDWYVTTADDGTDIWFTGEVRSEDQPSAFWFRSGGTIVLDIVHCLANQCGSFLVADDSGTVLVLIVPDLVFGNTDQAPPAKGFMEVFTQRLPQLFHRLETSSSPNESRFLLSQVRQALDAVSYLYPSRLHIAAEQGLQTFVPFLSNDDPQIRSLAFDLLASFRNSIYASAASLGDTIAREQDATTKADMIWAVEPLLAKSRPMSGVAIPPTKSLLDILILLVASQKDGLPVRFAAANTVIRALPGYCPPAFEDLLRNALEQPELHTFTESDASDVRYQVLKTLKLLQFHQRLRILRSALPQIRYAEDSHEVLRTLLDNVFFGEERTLWMSTLPQDYPAERPIVDNARFREQRTDSWLYPVHPRKINPTELMTFQREILLEVLEIDIPWMVHSNLLEKYGLPVTRVEVRRLLTD